MSWRKPVSVVISYFGFSFEKRSHFQQIVRVTIPSFDGNYITLLYVFRCLHFNKHSIPFIPFIFIQLEFILFIKWGFPSLIPLNWKCVKVEIPTKWHLHQVEHHNERWRYCLTILELIHWYNKCKILSYQYLMLVFKFPMMFFIFYLFHLSHASQINCHVCLKTQCCNVFVLCSYWLKLSTTLISINRVFFQCIHFQSM